MCIDNVSNSMHIKYKQFAVDSSIYVVKVHLKSDDHAALRKKKDDFSWFRARAARIKKYLMSIN